jgi:hypothetical protein
MPRTAVLVGVISTGNMREFVLYAATHDWFPAFHAELRTERAPHDVQMFGKMDPDWQTYGRFVKRPGVGPAAEPIQGSSECGRFRSAFCRSEGVVDFWHERAISGLLIGTNPANSRPLIGGIHSLQAT